MQCLALAALLIVAPVRSMAQTPIVNPTKLLFNVSADHNVILADGRPAVDHYNFDVYSAGAAQPFQSTNIGKPVPDATGVVTYDFSGKVAGWPLPGGNYVARVSAVGPGGTSVSDPSNQFSFASSSTCTYALSPMSASLPAGGGGTQVDVATSTGCAWTASSGVSWITLSPTSGSGSGRVVMTVAANGSSSSRTGTVTVAGLAFTVSEAGTGGGGTALPSPWKNQDVGSVALAGTASYSSGLFTVNGSGADIWGTADGFQFVYQPLNGGGQVVARLTGEQNTDPYAKAGIMIREDLGAGSRHVLLDRRPGGDVEFMSRSGTGGSTAYLGGTTQATPAWLRLTRDGNAVTAAVSSDGATWRTVGSTSVTMAASVYVGLVVCSHTAGSRNASTFDHVTVGAGAALPSPWTQQDVGSVGVAGSGSYSSGAFTVSGAGADIWGTADSFHYVSQPLNSATTIVARVAGVQNTGTYAKAGVMFRGALGAGAAHAVLDVKPGGGVEFMVRSASGGTTAYVAGSAQAAPVWLRLVRSGSTITASTSPDGTTWQTVGSASVSLGAAPYAGLAVCSHDTARTNTSTFDSVSVR